MGYKSLLVPESITATLHRIFQWLRILYETNANLKETARAGFEAKKFKSPCLNKFWGFQVEK